MIGFSSGVLECFAVLAGGAAQGVGDAAGKSETLPVFRINGEKSQRTPGFFLDIETLRQKTKSVHDEGFVVFRKSPLEKGCFSKHHFPREISEIPKILRRALILMVILSVLASRKILGVRCGFFGPWCGRQGV